MLMQRDASFDPVSATVQDWIVYLSNSKNRFKDYTRSDHLPPMGVCLKELANSEISDIALRDITARIVRAIFDPQGSMPTENDCHRGEQHPITYVSLLAYKNGTIRIPLVAVVQKLWDHVSEEDPCGDFIGRTVVSSLGVLIPKNLSFLEKLYTEHGHTHALEIILRRGDLALANKLFRENLDRYNGLDPLNLDYLLWAGLSFRSAKKWLDQSSNAGPGYEGNYRDAIKRWSQIVTKRKEKTE